MAAKASALCSLTERLLESAQGSASMSFMVVNLSCHATSYQSV
jgi:hypothetical protein